ncbi:phospholipid phosphatase 1 [Nematostella vectensis]|uniref:phospholipid phosphatase 1 n=1 Tax=Nematostella vectensis TaxID=45351 RepID=UPI00138FF778|nr:phospholipid phosphatase 1 [Nematostella vectensis]
MASPQSLFCISLEVICFFGLIILSAVLNEFIYLRVGGLQPFKRGFFCNDMSIQKPLLKDSVPFEAVIGIGVTFTLFMIVSLECGNQLTKPRREGNAEDEEWDDKKLGSVVIPSWIIRMLHRMAVFLYGIPLLFLIFNVVSVMTGRLTPNFLAVCKPNTTLFDCNEGYITKDVCTGDALDVKRARLSFPSVNTLVAMYCMVFVALSLQAAECLSRTKLLRTALQVAAILGALAVGMSRVKDYSHHWSDVAAGVILGSAAAWLLATKVCGLFDVSKHSLKPYSLLRLDNDADEEREGLTRKSMR